MPTMFLDEKLTFNCKTLNNSMLFQPHLSKFNLLKPTGHQQV